MGELGKAIENFENFVLRSKEGEVYRVLISVIEKNLLESVLQRTEGNQLKAARILGMNRNTLHAKIKKLKIIIQDFKSIRNAGYRKVRR